MDGCLAFKKTYTFGFDEWISVFVVSYGRMVFAVNLCDSY